MSLLEKLLFLLIILLLTLQLSLEMYHVFVSGPETERKLMDECVASGDNTHFECKSMVDKMVWGK